MITLKNVTKQYLYGERVLHSLSLVIESGQSIAVLGDTGSGKTSLLKAIAGATDFQGEIKLDGHDITAKHGDVIMQFDDFALFRFRSFYANLAYPLKIRKISSENIDKVVQDVALKFGLTACLREIVAKATELEKRKLALARLFVRKAKVVILDEPLRGLRKSDQNQLLSLLLPLIFELKSKGVTVIFSTDDIDVAKAVGDKIAVLSCGTLRQFGDIRTIIEQPESLWAIDAVCKTFNSFRGKLTMSENDALVFKSSSDVNEFALNIPASDSVLQYIGKPVIVGVRASDMNIETDRNDEDVICDEIAYVETTIGGYLYHTKGGLCVLSECKPANICGGTIECQSTSQGTNMSDGCNADNTEKIECYADDKIGAKCEVGHQSSVLGNGEQPINQENKIKIKIKCDKIFLFDGINENRIKL